MQFFSQPLDFSRFTLHQRGALVKPLVKPLVKALVKSLALLSNFGKQTVKCHSDAREI